MLLPLLAGWPPSPASAHPEIAAEIRLLTARIEKEGANPSCTDLYLRRGELHRVHENWEQALSDYARALSLDPPRAEVYYCRARLLLEKGEPRAALAEADTFLKRRPEEARGLALRANIHAALGDHDQAAHDYAAAIRQSAQPGADLYLRRAESLLAMRSPQGGEARALQAIEEGIARLGPVVTLVHRAIALELARGNYEGALARIDWIQARSANAAPWLKRRGDVLVEAGRSEEAMQAYRLALEQLDHLPDVRRNVRAFRALRKEIETALAVLRGREEVAKR